MSARSIPPVAVLDWTTVWLEIETSERGLDAFAWLKGKPRVKLGGLSGQDAALQLARKVYWPRDAGLPEDWSRSVALVHAGARGEIRTFKARLKRKGDA